MDNFEIGANHYWREFKNIGRGRKLLVAVLLIAVFLIGISLPIGLSKFSGYQSTKLLPSPTPIPLPAVISLSTDKSEISAGTNFSAIININSPNQGVEAADFVVDFDPNYLRVATVSAGNYFGLYPVIGTDANSANISGIANLVNNKFIIPVGRGKIGTIEFEALATTESTKISFDREKTIVASGGQNILDQTKITDLQITIK